MVLEQRCYFTGRKLGRQGRRQAARRLISSTISSGLIFPMELALMLQSA